MSVPEVMKVSKVVKVMMGEVMKVMEVGEVASWKHRAMVDHAKVVWAAEAVHTAKAVHAAHASHAAHHRVGRHHWRGKHCHHDSTSDRYFAEHDNSPDCPPRYSENAMQNVQMTIDLISDRCVSLVASHHRVVYPMVTNKQPKFF
jgi:hypothetical protein